MTEKRFQIDSICFRPASEIWSRSNLAFSVVTVSYGSSFFPLRFMACMCASCLGHKSKWKNSVSKRYFFSTLVSFNWAFSVKKGLLLHATHFQGFFFLVHVFLREVKNFLAIGYSNNFQRTCHFQVAWPWTPSILFPTFLVFPLTSTNKTEMAITLAGKITDICKEL